MKKIILILTVFLALNSIAQTDSSNWAWYLNVHTSQYNGDLENQIGKKWDHISLLNTGAKYYLNPSLDVTGGVSAGKLNASKEAQTFRAHYFDTDLGLEYKFNNGYLLKEEAKIKPFVMVGAGIVFYNGESSFNIPVGAGIRIPVRSDIDLNFSGVYKISNSDYFSGYLQPRIGIVIRPGSQENKIKDSDNDGVPDLIDVCPNVKGDVSEKGCPKKLDTDGDGVEDEKDNCPTLAGLESLNGCPDSDEDGIIDGEDKCPNEKGTKENNGCPDSDADGVIDSEDNCPTIAGTLNGCPDSDSDGIRDKEDKCPMIAGIQENNGCPEVKEEVKKIFEEALTGIQFQSGKAVLKKSSYSTLNKIATQLKENSTYQLEVSGYTDNTGDAQKNLILSEKRAQAAVNYLVKKGVDQSRFKVKGFGIEKPISSNETAAGRAKNRRVEFKVAF